MPELTQDLRDLAAAHGVATEYHDWRGNLRSVVPETVVAVLAAMDVDAATPEATAAALTEHRASRWRRMLEPCIVVGRGTQAQVPVHVADGEPVELWVELEGGGRSSDVRQVDRWVDPREVDGALVGEATFELPVDLPLGYHTLVARSGAREASSTLVVTPLWLGLPESMASRRGWGFATQLYSVRSNRSWGVGDLVDLTDLAVWSASSLGADYLLVNPLHAGEPVAPLEPSPYLPVSRRFFNPLYLRVERIPEFADLPRAEQAKVGRRFASLRRRLESVDLIDRDTSWTAKREALRLVHAAPRTPGREADFQAFRHRGGEGLRDFAVWNAIAQRHGPDFRTWPQELQDPGSEAVARVHEEESDEIDFQMWLQWVTDEQLQTVQAKAVGAGMALGVMHDLAVGVHPGGADAWRLQTVYAQGVRVGAPPDDYNQRGQNWSQPPWRPDRLAESAYRPFRELLGAVLAYAGGVRVDHIIGLFRLWWIPEGVPPSEGAYVRYDHDALIGILALEAHRAGAVVVGEDLGNVDPSARQYLAGRGILGTSILWFERDEQRRPLAAERWREFCLASVTTHDLPPTAAYLASEHIRIRDELGLLPRPLEEEMAADTDEREAWLAELRRRGLLGDDDSVETVVSALHRYLALTPARLLCVSLADAVGDRRAQNQPGTTDEYPNWRVPLSGPDGKLLTLEDVLDSARVVALTDAVRD